MFQRVLKASLGAGSFVFAATLLLRIVVLGRLSASPLLLPSGGDMHFYNDWAQRILHDASSGHLAFYGLPGYAYLLALLYRIFGYNPFVPGLFQGLLDSATALVIYRITLSLLVKNEASPSAPATARTHVLTRINQPQLIALLAALAWTFFVPAQAFSGILMPTSWLVFSFWFVVWRLVRKETTPSSVECLLLGLLMGLTATAVATILFLIPLVLAALCLKRPSGSQKQVLAGAALLFLGVTAGTSPCWVHNYFIAHDRVVLSAHSGINFWVGNNPDANGYPRFPPGLRAGQAAMLEDSITAAETAAGRPLKRSEVSAYWSTRAKNFIVQHPLAWLRLLLLKLRNVCNAFSYDDLSIVTSLRETGILLPGFSFGLIAALALPGILLVWPTSITARWVIAAILLHVAALLTVFVTERYRLAIVPGLLIFAAIGLFTLWRHLIATRYARAFAYLFLLAISTTLTCWPQRDPALWALDAYNSGRQALQTGDLARAEKKLLLAHAYVPSNAETNFALGNLRLAQGRDDLAASSYLATLALNAHHRGALNNLGVMALEHDKYAEAESWFRYLAQAEARNAKTHYLLAKTLFARGQKEEAKSEIETAIQLRPQQDEFEELRNKIDAIAR
jgi:tetratricopeptide (TPR) repeat protein